MTELGGFPDPFAGARDLAELLAAACDAFEAALRVIRQHDQPDDDYFVPLVMAGAAAASARDYLLFAPSLADRQDTAVGGGHAGLPDARGASRVRPCGAADSGSGHPAGDGESDLADSALTARWLAWLCQLLGRRLTAAAVTARSVGDRRACLGAARCAREIAALMGGDSP